jgi:hypothetical protein
MSTERVFLFALLVGIASLLAGLGIARWNWREDIPGFSRNTNVFDVWLNPANYVKPGTISLIRLLRAVGAGLLLAAVAALVYQLILEIAR